MCVFCKQALNNGQDILVVTEKGTEGIKKSSKSRNESCTIFMGQRVHKECKQQFCNKNTIARDLKRKSKESQSASSPAKTRSKQAKPFDFAHDCLFCGLPAKDDLNKLQNDAYPVRTFNFQAKLEIACAARGHDKWAETVQGRMEFAQELHAADAVYHNKCNVNFRTGRDIPKVFQGLSQVELKPKGRPEDPERAEAFLKTAEYFAENDDEQITISELCQKMGEYCEDP